MGTTQSSSKRDDALSMPGAELKGQDEPTLLEVVLQVQGDSRGQLAPLNVTPLQTSSAPYPILVTVRDISRAVEACEILHGWQWLRSLCKP